MAVYLSFIGVYTPIEREIHATPGIIILHFPAAAAAAADDWPQPEGEKKKKKKRFFCFFFCFCQRENITGTAG
jgi:hypothetical protein